MTLIKKHQNEKNLKYLDNDILDDPTWLMDSIDFNKFGFFK